MDFHVYLSQQTHFSSLVEYPDLYVGCGFTLSGSNECVVFPDYGDSKIVALLGNPYQDRNIWGIATEVNAVRYASLNQTSYEGGRPC